MFFSKIIADVGSSTLAAEPSTSSLSSRGGLGTATGRSMNIEEVTPTGTAIIADSTETSAAHDDSDEGKPTKATSAEGSDEMMENSSKMTSGSVEEAESGEMMIAKPGAGCMYNGSEYQVGHEILNGCDEKCTCMESGEVKCIDRCLIPTFKKGAFAHDKMCSEEAVDECCVIIACARGSAPGNGAAAVEQRGN